jgi:hypothetical protein
MGDRVMDANAVEMTVPPNADRDLMGIQDVAAMLGVTHRTLRFYEDKGLIEPQRVATPASMPGARWPGCN